MDGTGAETADANLPSASHSCEAPGRSEPLAVLATEAGYADQAHMTREFRALAGATPRAFDGRPIRSRQRTSGGRSCNAHPGQGELTMIDAPRRLFVSAGPSCTSPTCRRRSRSMSALSGCSGASSTRKAITPSSRPAPPSWRSPHTSSFDASARIAERGRSAGPKTSRSRWWPKRTRSMRPTPGRSKQAARRSSHWRPCPGIRSWASS